MKLHTSDEKSRRNFDKSRGILEENTIVPEGRRT
jgi:hypothetical protein